MAARPRERPPRLSVAREAPPRCRAAAPLLIIVKGNFGNATRQQRWAAGPLVGLPAVAAARHAPSAACVRRHDGPAATRMRVRRLAMTASADRLPQTVRAWLASKEGPQERLASRATNVIYVTFSQHCRSTVDSPGLLRTTTDNHQRRHAHGHGFASRREGLHSRSTATRNLPMVAGWQPRSPAALMAP